MLQRFKIFLFFQIILVTTLSLVACDKQESKAIHLDAQQAKELLEQGPTFVLDVRTPEEYQAGHIADSRLINYKDANFKQQLADLDRNLPYLIHCKSGGRSGKTLEIMSEMGFTKVYHLDGGFDAWKEAGFAINQ